MVIGWAVAVLGAVALAVVSLLTVGLCAVCADTVRRRGRWGINTSPVRCPGCGEPTPAVRLPRNMRQVIWGRLGMCRACGLELDKWGGPLGEEDIGADA